MARGEDIIDIRDAGDSSVHVVLRGGQQVRSDMAGLFFTCCFTGLCSWTVYH